MDGDSKKDELSLEPATSVVVSGTTKTVDDEALDEAAKYLARQEQFGPMTAEQEKVIVKKIDSWIIPLVSATDPGSDLSLSKWMTDDTGIYHELNAWHFD